MENQKTVPPSDEIDLGQLFAKIGNFFKSIGFGMIEFFALVRNVPLKNKTLFISLVVAGGLVGFFYASILKKKYYETSMILSSDYLNKRIVDNSIQKLNLLADEVSPKGLASVLKIPESLALNIIKFEAKPFVAEQELIEMEILKEQLKSAQLKNQDAINQITARIEIENQHAFEFSIRSLNPTVVKPIQNALVNYFKSNEYIKRRIEISRSNLIDKQSKLSHDLQKLDSLKFIIYDNYKSMASQSRQGSNNVILSDKAVTDPVQIYHQDLLLYNQFQEVNRLLYLQTDFELVDGFTEFSEPSSASLSKIIASGVLLGFVLGYLIVGLKNFNNYLSTIN